jgi:hypothetical protein
MNILNFLYLVIGVVCIIVGLAVVLAEPDFRLSRTTRHTISAVTIVLGIVAIGWAGWPIVVSIIDSL